MLWPKSTISGGITLNLVQLLKYISVNFANDSQDDSLFKQNAFIRTWKESLNDALPLPLLPSTIITDFSAGTGKWAQIPWMALLDTEITKSVQKGISIVFLFTTDAQGVYLTLNQGWTSFEKTYGKEAAASISTISQYFQRKLAASVRGNQFTTEPIHLNSNGDKLRKLAKGYEAGTVFNKYYDIASLTDKDNNQLIRDLLALAFTYQQLKETLNGTEYKEKVSEILSESTTVIEDDAPNQATSLHEDSTPYVVDSPAAKSGRVTKTDYLEQEKRNAELGRQGEQFVIAWEKDRLSMNPLLKPYVDQIRHVSVEHGDGLGYDVLSFTVDPKDQVKEIHIEVKTTNSKDSKTPFFISANEWAYLNANKDDFRLYRIYDFSGNPQVNTFTTAGLLAATTHTPADFQISFK